MQWMRLKFALLAGAGTVAVITATTVVLAAGDHTPPGATVADTPDSTLLIVPGVSVGKVKAGMNEIEVAAALGAPEKMQGDVMIYDQHLGLSVVCNRQKIVGAVFCGDSLPEYPGVKIFKGRTKEGIGMGSSRDDLIKAFGKPATDQPWSRGSKREQIIYPNLGLTFTLARGKVFHIMVDLRKHS